MLSNKKNYFYTLASSFGAMVTSSLVGFIAVPVGLKYFKTEQYGVWTLISSVLVYLAVSNLGVNTAASVLMAKIPGVKDKLLVLARSLKLLLFFASCAICGFAALSYFSTDWIYVLGKIPANLARETYLTCLILGLFYLVNIPFSLINSALNGFQKVYIDNLFNAALTVINFFALLITVWTNGGLVRLAILTGSFTFGFNLVKFGYLYFIVLPEMRALPAPAAPDVTDQHELSYDNIMRTGLRFLLIGLAALIVWNTDNFLISRIIGVGTVVPYFITFKLYYILFSFIFIVNNSSLSLMGREFGKKNWDWLNKIYSNLLIITVVIGGLAWISGLFFFKDLVRLWVGDEGYAGLTVVFFFGAYAYIVGMVNLNSGLINTFNYTKNIPWVGWLEAAVKLGVTYTGLKLWGLPGAAIGTFTGCLLSNTWILPLVLSRRSGGRIKIRQDFVLKHFAFILFPLVCAGLLTQHYAGSALLRVSCGAAGLAVYSWFSYKITPPDVRAYVKELAFKFKARLVQT